VIGAKMKQIKREKAFWKKYFNFSVDLDGIPAAIEHASLRCTETKDEDLMFLVTGIKQIEVLELDQTEITSEGIKHVAKLQGLKELRLKDNYGIDNTCIPYVNQLSTWRLLHVGSTAITIDGLLKLTELLCLETLLFDANDLKEIDDKMFQ
jgi:hypothetical protein